MEGPEAVHLRIVSDYDAPEAINLTKDPFYCISTAQHSELAGRAVRPALEFPDALLEGAGRAEATRKRRLRPSHLLRRNKTGAENNVSHADQRN